MQFPLFPISVKFLFQKHVNRHVQSIRIRLRPLNFHFLFQPKTKPTLIIQIQRIRRKFYWFVIFHKLLSELILSGDIDEELDGGKLLTLFRAVGINIRLNTKINIKEDGKFVSLSEKFKTKDSDSSN